MSTTSQQPNNFFNGSRHVNPLWVSMALALIFFLSIIIPSSPEPIANFLLFHTLIEFFTVAVALMVFTTGWNSKSDNNTLRSTLIAVAFLAVGLLDLCHLLSYAGMPDYITPNSPAKAIDYWLAARITAAVAFLILAIAKSDAHIKPMLRRLSLVAALSLVVAINWLILFRPTWLPSTFIAEQGLTSAKITTEYLLCLAYGAAAFLLWRKPEQENKLLNHWLATALVIMVLSELFFTLYVQVTDIYNFLGHIYKFIAYIIIYRTLCTSEIHRPYLELSQSKQRVKNSEARYHTLLDSAMDAIILIDEQHNIVVFNPAAELMFGYKSSDVLHQPLEILIPEDYRDHHKQHIDSFAKYGHSNRQPNEYLTVNGRRANGEIFPAEASINRVSLQQQTYFSVFLHDLTEQQKTHKKIEVSEKRFRTLLSNLPGVVYRSEIQPPWPVEFISAGILELTGHSASEFQAANGIHYANFIHPDDIAMVEKRIAQGVENQHHFELQYRLIDRHGQVRWVQEKGICQYDAAGSPAFLDGFIHDITQQKHAELALVSARQDLERRMAEQIETQRKLHEREIHLRTIADNTRQSYYITQINPTKSIYISPKSEEILGIPLARLYNENLSWADIIHHDDRNRIDQLYQKWIQTRTASFDTEYRIYHAQKGMRWIRASGSWIKDDPTLTNCYSGIIEDITLRKQTELALRASEEQFRVLAENIDDVFWLISPARDNLLYISPAFEKVWGRPVLDILNNPHLLLDTVHPDDRGQLMQDHAEQLAGMYFEHYEREFRILRPNNEIRWIVSRYSPIRNNKGEVDRIAGVSEDITERKLMEQQRIEHEQQQRNTLVREVHHRIKNNLQGVIGLLRQNTQQYPELQQATDNAVSQVSTMAIVHGLQSKNRNEEIILCDLCDAIARSIVGLTGTSLQPRVTRQALLPIALQQKETVPIALILNELIFNAVKHQDKNAQQKVSIVIELQDTEIVITITNQSKSLPKGLDIANNRQLGTGLTLVRTLLPKGAHLAIRQNGPTILTTLRLNQTLVNIPEALRSAEVESSDS